MYIIIRNGSKASTDGNAVSLQPRLGTDRQTDQDTPGRLTQKEEGTSTGLNRTMGTLTSSLGHSVLLGLEVMLNVIVQN